MKICLIEIENGICKPFEFPMPKTPITKEQIIDFIKYFENKKNKMKKTTTQQQQKPQPKKAVAKKSTKTLVNEKKKSIFSVVIDENGDLTIEHGGNNEELIHSILLGCEENEQMNNFVKRLLNDFMLFELKKTFAESLEAKLKKATKKPVSKKVAKKK